VSSPRLLVAGGGRGQCGAGVFGVATGGEHAEAQAVDLATLRDQGGSCSGRWPRTRRCSGGSRYQPFATNTPATTRGNSGNWLWCTVVGIATEPSRGTARPPRRPRATSGVPGPLAGLAGSGAVRHVR
jgi:hypothetical protein